MLYEYSNISGGRQAVTGVILDAQGKTLPGVSPKRQILESESALQMDLDEWRKGGTLQNFSGQFLLLVDQVTPAQRNIMPAITAHWMSPGHHCEIATAAFANVNLKSFKGKKSFYMYCPMTVFDAKRETLVTLFNHSTDATYQDSVDLRMTLFGGDGEKLEGPDAVVPPFGALLLEVGRHFGKTGEEFFARYGGNASLAMSHIGHTLPAFFFHLSRSTSDVISGQHSQPPMSALSARPGIWWGKLRRFGI
jgi:hypothetical protein